MPIIDMRAKFSEDTKDEEEVKEEADEIIPQEEENKETSEKGTETLPDSSTEKEPSTTIETKLKNNIKESTDAELQTKVSTLKQQEETLRKQIVELRMERRKERYEDPLIVQKKEVVEVDELKDTNPEDVALIEKVLKAKGYVRKEDVSRLSYQEKIDKTKNDWLNEHKEYLPENDSNDQNWNELNKTLGLYFKAPNNPEDIKKVMDLAHKMIKGDSKTLPIQNEAQNNSAKEKLKIVSKSGSGNSIASSPKSVNTKKIDTSYLKGFSEEELKEFNS